MTSSKFTHLLPADAQLMAAFLELYPDRYNFIDYDIKVGVGRDPGPAYSDHIRKMAVHLSQRRIDAVGTAPNFIELIEITTSAGLTALGQLQAYPILYLQTYLTSLPVLPLLLTYGFQSDMEHVYRENAIPFIIIPRPGSQS